MSAVVRRGTRPHFCYVADRSRMVSGSVPNFGLWVTNCQAELGVESQQVIH
jgi:hypothetical protein